MNETRKTQKSYVNKCVHLFKILSVLRYRLMPLLLGTSQKKLPQKSLYL